MPPRFMFLNCIVVVAYTVVEPTTIVGDIGVSDWIYGLTASVNKYASNLLLEASVVYKNKDIDAALLGIVTLSIAIWILVPELMFAVNF